MKSQNPDDLPPQPYLDICKFFYERHCAILADSELVLPAAIIIKDGNTPEILDSAFFEENGDKDKDYMAKAIQQRASKHGADGVLFFSEGWMISGSTEEVKALRAQYKNIADMPQRIEVITYVLETRAGNYNGRARITGEERTPRQLGAIEWMKGEGSGGRFSRFLPTIYATPEQVMAYLAKAQKKLRELGVDPERKFATKSLTEIMAEQFRQAPAERLTDDMLESFVEKIKLAYDQMYPAGSA